ncbi:unnamed protein product [Mytilus coruscus]|uniref:C1q domain-containing protein n=1 Tax=Mytilus coruscus TaxID=42192 RepID=A0A6J7ZZF6_MYTCO|nr:unnamed protein product [Mytilus coruscus]
MQTIAQSTVTHTQPDLHGEYLAIRKQQQETLQLLTSLQKTVTALQTQVKAVAVKTFILDSNERVRTNAVDVLYNKTFETEKILTSLEVQTQQLKEQLEMNQNETSAHEETLQEIARKGIVTHETLKKQIALSQEKVAVLMCVSTDGDRYSRQIIKFDEIRFHIGIINFSAIRSSGVFTAEKPGLYHISAVINGRKSNAQFSIHVNGNTLSTLRMSSNEFIATGTSVVATELQIGDIISVTADSTFQQTVNTLQTQVRAVGAKTYILDSNERVRTNAVDVLYNKTLETQTVLNRLEAQTYQLKERVEYNLNETANHAETLLEVARKDAATRDILDKQVVLSNEKVAVTTCVSVDGDRHSGQTIKFDEIRSHTGIINLSSIRSSGVFTVEKPGLYHISVVINGRKSNAQFSIHINGNSLSTLRMSSDETIATGTSVVAVDLQTGDIVAVAADSLFQVYFHWSCLTVVKIN